MIKLRKIAAISLALSVMSLSACRSSQGSAQPSFNNYVDDSSVSTFLSNANSQYIVDRNIDLKGRKINAASNCCIYFIGGSIMNGEIVGNNTKILASNNQILKNVKTSGSWNIVECYPEWWGAVGDGKTDDYAALQSAIDFVKQSGACVRLGSAKYFITKPLIWNVQDGTPSPTFNMSGNGVNSSRIIFSGSSAINITWGVNPHLSNFSIMSKNDYKGVGIVLGTMDSEATFVVRGLFENLYIYNCETGVYAYGWMNQWNNLNARFNKLGVKDLCTVSSYNNPIIEGNELGMQVAGKTAIVGGTIEGNKGGGLEVLGGKHTLTSVYFEANCPNDKSTDLNVYGIQNKGFQIKAGYSSPCELILNTCNFSSGAYSHGRNTVELDKVTKLINNCCDDFTLLYTDNTGDYIDNSSIPSWQNGFSSNSNLEFYGRIKKASSTSSIATASSFCASTTAMTSKRNMPQRTNSSLIYLNADSSAYCRLSNASNVIYNEDGSFSLISMDKSSYSHTLKVCVNWDKLQNRSGKITCEADIQILANKAITAKAYPSCGFSCDKNDGTAVNFVQSSAINAVDYYSFNPIRSYRITVDLDSIRAEIQNRKLSVSKGEVYFTFQFRYSGAVPAQTKEAEAADLQMKVSQITLF